MVQIPLGSACGTSIGFTTRKLYTLFGKFLLLGLKYIAESEFKFGICVKVTRYCQSSSHEISNLFSQSK